MTVKDLEEIMMTDGAAKWELLTNSQDIYDVLAGWRLIRKKAVQNHTLLHDSNSQSKAKPRDAAWDQIARSPEAEPDTQMMRQLYGLL